MVSGRYWKDQYWCSADASCGAAAHVPTSPTCRLIASTGGGHGKEGDGWTAGQKEPDMWSRAELCRGEWICEVVVVGEELWALLEALIDGALRGRHATCVRAPPRLEVSNISP